MIPRDLAKTPITVYNYFRPTSESYTYKRTVLLDCVWQQDSHSTYKSTGVLNAEAVKILIPYNSRYCSVQNGEVFEGVGWTVNIAPELEGSYFVRGVCPFEFPEIDPEISFDADAFFKNSVQSFEKQYQYKRPKELIHHFAGSRGMWFLEVRG